MPGWHDASGKIRGGMTARGRRITVKGASAGAGAVGAGAIGTLALGSFALGAIAMGAVAVGALAIGRLSVGKARFKQIEIDELTVHKLRVESWEELPGNSLAEALEASDSGSVVPQEGFQPIKRV